MDKFDTFRALHRPGDPFIMANVWDLGSARLLAGIGAKALATSSAALAYATAGRDLGHISRDTALAHAQDIVAATDLPVQGDFEDGFGANPDDVAETVRLAAEVGLAGICVEDIAYPGTTPIAFDLAVERMKAGAAAARALGRDFFFVARADGVMHGAYDIDEALRRIAAFDAAGADGLYVPMPASMNDLARICAATSKPVNALAAGPFAKVSRAEFAAAGAARISLGSALANITYRLMHDAAAAMLENGDFTPLGAGISAEKIAQLQDKGAPQG